MNEESDLNFRKRIAVALCELLPVAGVSIVQRLQQVLEIIIDVMRDGTAIVDVRLVNFYFFFLLFLLIFDLLVIFLMMMTMKKMTILLVV